MATECLICTSTIPTGRGYRLGCGHVHCERCLQANFRITMRTTPFRPVQCCNRIHPTLLRRVLTDTQTPNWTNDMMLYRQRVAEYDARDKLYCWDPKCSAFIPLALREGTANSAKCRKCHTKTCVACRGKFHFGSCSSAALAMATAKRGASTAGSGVSKRETEAERTARAARVVEIRRRRGEEAFKKLASAMRWKPCPECKRVVEKVEGCNHIVCTCGCHWCYRCGKTPYGNHGPCAM
ncbi:hypothetical protein B0H67DRAFT_48477 [Lasiosphaeris hirsuta]|uniref:RBR-type E3 ubiquitin transferase n=1 Tax=Lasiosphaeris hirsuta TaxID=260670 RepID=A0AA40EB29_9PEZI|nr:hypothetical protein B0H67DRAFT_48477 [Lasiosphaeris hirsuta]